MRIFLSSEIGKSQLLKKIETFSDQTGIYVIETTDDYAALPAPSSYKEDHQRLLYTKVVAGSVDYVEATKKVIRIDSSKKFCGINLEINGTEDHDYGASTARLLWDVVSKTWRGKVADFLGKLYGGSIRYPGGSTSNTFSLYHSVVGVSQYVAEWLRNPRVIVWNVTRFIDSLPVGVSPLITINLNGYGDKFPISDMSDEELSLDVNRVLSVLPKSKKIVFELGNECYFTRSAEWYERRAGIAARIIRARIPDALIFGVGLLNDQGSVVRKEWNQGVAKVQEINGLALHPYCDSAYYANDNVDLMRRVIRNAQQDWNEIRGEPPRIWLTEYGLNSYRCANNSVINDNRSGIQGSITAADILCMALQNTFIDAAQFWASGLTSYPLFYDEFNPRLVYWAIRAYEYASVGSTLGTISTSKNDSGYGYDIRAVIFEGAAKIGVFIVNRHWQPKTVTIKYLPYANLSKNFSMVGVKSSYSDNPYKTVEGVVDEAGISIDAATNSFNKDYTNAFSVFKTGDAVKAKGNWPAGNNGAFTVASVSPDGKKMVVSGGTLITSPVTYLSAVTLDDNSLGMTINFSDEIGQSKFTNGGVLSGSAVFNSSGECNLSISGLSVSGFIIQ